MKIVVRSYKRSDTIMQKTLRCLGEQTDLNLERDLYIVVHRDEEDLYREAVKGYPHADLIVKSERGGHNSTAAACRFFPEGEPLLHLDDDIDKILHTDRPMGKFVPLTCLGRYAQDAFATADKVGCTLWTFSEIQNSMWVAQKPWKEFRPCSVPGVLWGGRNVKGLTTSFAHEDDAVRACRFFDKEGGAILYNWAHTKSKPDNPGGLQAGDRGTKEQMKAVVEELFRTEPAYAKFRKGPVWIPSFNNWGSRMRSLTHAQKVRPFRHWKWGSYFQCDPDPQEEVGDLLSLFE